MEVAVPAAEFLQRSIVERYHIGGDGLVPAIAEVILLGRVGLAAQGIEGCSGAAYDAVVDDIHSIGTIGNRNGEPAGIQRGTVSLPGEGQDFIGFAGQVASVLFGQGEGGGGFLGRFEGGLGIDGIDLFAVLFPDGTATGQDNLFGQHYGTLDDIFDGGVGHIETRHVDVAVVEGLGPVLERHGAVQRNAANAVDDAQEAAHRGGLVVTVEAHGTTDEEGLFNVSVAVQQGQDTHCAVQVGIPDALGDVGLVHIELIGNHLARSLPIVRVLLPQLQAFVDDMAETVSLGEIFLGVADERGNVTLEEGLGVHGAIYHGRGDGPVVGGDAGSPVGDGGGILGHAGSRVGPNLVDELRVDLEPVRVVFLLASVRRRETIVHQAQGGAIG